VAFDNLPWDLDPSQGFLSSANNLSAAPEPVWDDVLLGPYGDTSRSWRLREYLSRLVSFPPATQQQLLALDVDKMSPVMRVSGKLADHAVAIGHVFDANAAPYVQTLANWSCDVPAGGCWELSTAHPDFQALWKIQGALSRIGQTTALASLVQAFGDGAGGLCNMLKTAESMGVPAFVAAYPASLDWLNARMLVAAANPNSAPNPFPLRHHHNLQFDLFSGGPEELHGAGPFSASLDNVFAGTIWSQQGESYVFLADLANPDGALALCPPGVSEETNSASFWAHLTAWQAGSLYTAPITRPAVEAQGSFTVATITIP